MISPLKNEDATNWGEEGEAFRSYHTIKRQQFGGCMKRTDYSIRFGLVWFESYWNWNRTNSFRFNMFFLVFGFSPTWIHAGMLLLICRQRIHSMPGTYFSLCALARNINRSTKGNQGMALRTTYYNIYNSQQNNFSSFLLVNLLEKNDFFIDKNEVNLFFFFLSSWIKSNGLFSSGKLMFNKIEIILFFFFSSCLMDTS